MEAIPGSLPITAPRVAKESGKPPASLASMPACLEAVWFPPAQSRNYKASGAVGSHTCLQCRLSTLRRQISISGKLFFELSQDGNFLKSNNKRPTILKATKPYCHGGMRGRCVSSVRLVGAMSSSPGFSKFPKWVRAKKTWSLRPKSVFLAT